jgi:hypothetical protein
VHFVGLPPGTVDLLIKFVPPERWNTFSASLSFRVRSEEYLGDFSHPCPPDLKVRFSVSAKCAKRRRPGPIQSGGRGFEFISLQSSSRESVANLTLGGTQEPQQKIPPARSAFPIWQQTHRWQVPDVRPAKRCDNITVNAQRRRPRRNPQGKPKWNGRRRLLGLGAEKYRRNRQAIIDGNLAELRRATSQKPLDFQ